MRDITRAARSILVFVLSTAAGLASAAERWSGTMQLPGGQALDFSVTLESGDDGWIGSIDIPAQGASGLGLSNITRTGTGLSFEIAAVGARFSFTHDGANGNGQLDQSGMTFPGTIMRGPDVADGGVAAPPKTEAKAGGVEETWTGKVTVGPQELGFTAKLAEAEGGGWVGTIEIPLQGVSGLPLQDITRTADRVEFTIAGLGAAFGFDLDGNAGSGALMQGGGSFPGTVELAGGESASAAASARSESMASPSPSPSPSRSSASSASMSG
ncbi:MAG: hypothetical protein AAF533_02010, partial [Acidobacteriota bacterium]